MAKPYYAAGQERADVRAARLAWRDKQKSLDPQRLVFIGETSASTTMTPRHGRRKPPDESPKASVRPVVMIMITAMIFATRPSTDCSTCCSGCENRGLGDPSAVPVFIVGMPRSGTTLIVSLDLERFSLS